MELEQEENPNVMKFKVRDPNTGKLVDSAADFEKPDEPAKPEPAGEEQTHSTGE